MELIDKNAVVAEIENKIKKYTLRGEESDFLQDGNAKYWGGVLSCLNEIHSYLDTLEVKNDVKDLITSLQPELDVVSTAKVFLDALSKTPYNNKPITDAQIIVKQLLLFLETPSKYNPDAIVEQPEVDLEKEFNNFLDNIEGVPRMWHSDEQIEWGKDIAKHFLELGISISNEAQKGE